MRDRHLGHEGDAGHETDSSHCLQSIDHRPERLFSGGLGQILLKSLLTFLPIMHRSDHFGERHLLIVNKHRSAAPGRPTSARPGSPPTLQGANSNGATSSEARSSPQHCSTDCSITPSSARSRDRHIGCASMPRCFPKTSAPFRRPARRRLNGADGHRRSNRTNNNMVPSQR